MDLLPPDSADLTLLQDRQVALLGFGPTGSAHALNLRDGGVDVRIGLPPDSRAAARAEVEGLLVVAPEAACRTADLVVVPVQDRASVPADQAWWPQVLEAGDMVLLTSATVLDDGALDVPDGVDVAVLQAIGGPHRLRGEYLDGRGVPCLAAIDQDATGLAWPVLTAYAAALGSVRSGAIRCTVPELVRAAQLASEQVHPEVFRLVEEGYRQLVDEGVSPEVAYLACLHDLKDRVDTAYFVGLGRGGGSPPGAEMEQAGRRVRSLMSWIR